LRVKSTRPQGPVGTLSTTTTAKDDRTWLTLPPTTQRLGGTGKQVTPNEYRPPEIADVTIASVLRMQERRQTAILRWIRQISSDHGDRPINISVTSTLSTTVTAQKTATTNQRGRSTINLRQVHIISIYYRLLLQLRFANIFNNLQKNGLYVFILYEQIQNYAKQKSFININIYVKQ